MILEDLQHIDPDLDVRPLIQQYILDNIGKIRSEVANIDIFSGKNITSNVNTSTTLNSSSTNQTINSSG